MAVAESEYWWLASHRQKSHAVEHPQRTLADPFNTFWYLALPAIDDAHRSQRLFRQLNRPLITSSRAASAPCSR